MADLLIITLHYSTLNAECCLLLYKIEPYHKAFGFFRFWRRMK